jgi:hypothetical protein
MNKIFRIGTVKVGSRAASIYVRAEFENGRLSISGVIGPLKSGEALGGCGQIDMEFKHRNPRDNDKRCLRLINPDEINFAKGWNRDLWFDLLDVWKRYHLNNMHAECEHQRKLHWTYREHHDPKTFKGDPCPVCGYEIGSKWPSEIVPNFAIDKLLSFPEADKNPAWV